MIKLNEENKNVVYLVVSFIIFLSLAIYMTEVYYNNNSEESKVDLERQRLIELMTSAPGTGSFTVSEEKAIGEAMSSKSKIKVDVNKETIELMTAN